MQRTFINVLLPLALPKPFTYKVPEALFSDIQFGIRVEVPFGKNKFYSGIITETNVQSPVDFTPKEIMSIIDNQPIISEKQLALWQWIADYYCATLGEVMAIALPTGLKLSSETKIINNPSYGIDFSALGDKEYLIAEALTIQHELSVDDVRKILGQQTIYPTIQLLLEKNVITIKEELQTKYKPKTVSCVQLSEPYCTDSTTLESAFEKLKNSHKQAEALLAYLQLSKLQAFVKVSDIYTMANVDSVIIKKLSDKHIFNVYERVVSRMDLYDDDTENSAELSDIQRQALQQIETSLQEKNTVLLHGVTGSGKTLLYIELIKKALQRGQQTLYLLPEIALTTQIISRLQKIFGNDIVTYHSKMNHHERVEVWQAVMQGKKIVLGARSALFLPYNNLSLIIVDEEHDSSYKQQDPAPRYQGRDVAIYMAKIFDAKVVLGTATPSIETYYNARKNKFGLVTISQRFGEVNLPSIDVIDVKEATKRKEMKSHFSKILIDAIETTLQQKKQIIIFKNRRGFAPTLRCTTCDWHSECKNCDVSLTYHKNSDTLRCHYCAYETKIYKSCPACGSKVLTLQGFGTEKIEDELKIFFPNAKIGRLDLDVARTKKAHTKIINEFEEHQLDILVGTQMVTKGLDFDSVTLVGVLSADQLFRFPEFRANERAFQLLTQVAGRAGRRKEKGKVLIQAYQPNHPVLQKVVENNYIEFYQKEIQERKEFAYPPFVRLIKITLKHKIPKIILDAANSYAAMLREELGEKVIGPAVPDVSRIRNEYLMDIMLKLEKDNKLIQHVKTQLQDFTFRLHQQIGFSGVRVMIDVDTY